MRKWLLLSFALLCTSLVGIAQEDENAVFVRVAHFAVDAPAVDIYLDGDLTLETVEFSSVSEWLEVDAGMYTLDIVPAGDALEDAILSDVYSLTVGDWTTFAVIGDIEDDSLTIQALTDDLSNIPDGSMFVSVFHAVADLEPVNVTVGDSDITELLSFSDTRSDSDSYVSDTIALDDYTLTIQDMDGNALDLAPIAISQADRAYFIAIIGQATSPQIVIVPTDISDEPSASVTADEADTDGLSALMRIAHFAPSAPDIDIYLNGDLRLEAFQFGDITDEYTEIDSGVYEVALVPTGEGIENAVYTGDVTIVADSLTMIAVIGFIENNSLTVVAVAEENVPPVTGAVRIAFFQTIPGLQEFDLLVNNEVLVQSLTYPNRFSGDGYVSFDLSANTYNFVIRGETSNINVGNIVTGDGRVYLLVSSGTIASPIFFLISGDFPTANDE